MYCKRFFCFILCIVLCICITGCKKDTVKKNNTPILNNEELQNTQHSGEKFQGEICSTSGFYDGVALVTRKDDANTLYCIDKDGYIVFKTEIDGSVHTALNFGKFRNGITVTDHNTIITKKGEIFTAEDLGCTAFYPSSLMYGCILAQKTSEDGTNMLGILDVSLKWISKPDAMYYTEFTDYLPMFSKADSFYHGSKEGYIYIYQTKSWFDIKKGIVVTELENESSSELWNLEKDNNVYYDRNGKIALRLGIYNEIVQTYDFLNGICVLRFIDKDGAEKLVAINEKGDEFFEPVPFETPQDVSWICLFDNQNIILFNNNTIKTYSFDGTLTAEKDISDLNFKNLTFSDGVITLHHFDAENNVDVYSFLKPNLTPLY